MGTDRCSTGRGAASNVISSIYSVAARQCEHDRRHGHRPGRWSCMQIISRYLPNSFRHFYTLSRFFSCQLLISEDHKIITIYLILNIRYIVLYCTARDVKHEQHYAVTTQSLVSISISSVENISSLMMLIYLAAGGPPGDPSVLPPAPGRPLLHRIPPRLLSPPAWLPSDQVRLFTSQLRLPRPSA